VVEAEPLDEAQARIEQLERELAEARQVRDLLKRTVAFCGGADTVNRYRCVAARKAEGFNVVAACGAAGVSTSAFYDWATNPEGPTEADIEEERLVAQIRQVHSDTTGSTASHESRRSCARGAGPSITNVSSG
jgi:transposase-like protein